MTPIIDHIWDLNEEDAVKLQKEMIALVVKKSDPISIQLIAGIDVAYSKFTDSVVAAVIVLDAETLQVVDRVTAVSRVHFPYIPGLFSFRELPPIIEAFAKLKSVPDLAVCDGQGYAHPRHFGMASHLGVIFNIPTIGCGKTRLCGEYTEPGENRGDRSPLVEAGEIIGSVLRTQNKVKPVFISEGNYVSLDTACSIVLRLSTSYRLPETTRLADHEVRVALKILEESKRI